MARVRVRVRVIIRERVCHLVTIRWIRLRDCSVKILPLHFHRIRIHTLAVDLGEIDVAGESVGGSVTNQSLDFGS